MKKTLVKLFVYVIASQIFLPAQSSCKSIGQGSSVISKKYSPLRQNMQFNLD